MEREDPGPTKFAAGSRLPGNPRKDRYEKGRHHGDEVRHDVDRKGELAGQGDEEDLSAARHARVAEQAATEDGAVRDEPGERAGALAPPGDQQREDEQGVEKGRRRRSRRTAMPTCPSGERTRAARASLLHRSRRVAEEGRRRRGASRIPARRVFRARQIAHARRVDREIV
jgi:hypothetical protein